ncbi:MAG: LuxR C-terminal-related transcriptional regulator [Leptospirales bacterium]
MTDKENQVLGLLVEGRTIQNAAKLLDVQFSTIHFHVKNIYKKLNVHNRAQLVKKASELGLF